MGIPTWISLKGYSYLYHPDSTHKAKRPAMQRAKALRKRGLNARVRAPRTGGFFVLFRKPIGRRK